MKSASHSLTYLGIFSLLVTVQACSSGSTHSSATSTLPVGTYTNSNTPHGAETLTILPGATYREDVPRILTTVVGTATVSGDKVTFTETSGGDCTGKPGVYTVTVTPAAVSFKKDQDTCPPRVADWTSGPWTIQH